jgi:hypothetical protein
MRTVQPGGERGSLKWIQLCVARRPDLLQPENLAPIVWVSPLGADGYAEYRDAAFLERVGQSALATELKAFWPERGPQWDALGLAGRAPVLVEAKAHIREFLTQASLAGPKSRARIDLAFSAVKRDLNVDDDVDWARCFYQYANRLAHLWWFHSHGVKANLLFVSFLNDLEMNGPTVRETWDAAFDVATYALGLSGNHRLARYVQHVRPDVRELS